MSLSKQFIVGLFRALTRAVFRIDDAQLTQVPEHGPLILVTNHINILEIPVIYSHLQPRPLHGLVLADRWKNRILAWGLNVCGTIPLERGGVNLDAMRQALKELKEGGVLIISPEGTRSANALLQTGQPGIVMLALKSGAPLLPIGYYGSENYKENLKKLKRTDFHLVVGKPFCLRAGTESAIRDVRAQMVDEIMYQLASILPEAYRGNYADMTKKTEKYVVF